MKPCISGAIAGGITAVVVLDVVTKGDLHRGVISSACGLFKGDDKSCGGGCCESTEHVEPQQKPETPVQSPVVGDFTTI